MLRWILGLALALVPTLAPAHLAPEPDPRALAGVQETPMSYAGAKQSLIDRIRLLTPDYDRELPFRSLRDVNGGRVAQLDQLVDDAVRVFDLSGGTPADDGASGYAFDRWRVPMLLRVRYSAADRDRADEQIASDIPRLTHALIHPAWPTPWHASVESVTPPAPPTISPLVGDEGLRGLVLSLRFDLIYRDSGLV